jgi:ADP-L-glycero-D-manno-heptose 6-epimerase
MWNQVIEVPYSRTDVGEWYIHKVLTDPLRDEIQMLRSQKICIMGGCGQVGSHVTTTLYAYGFSTEQILINDDLRLGQRSNLPKPWRDRVDTRSHLEYAQNPPSGVDIVIFVGGRSSAPHFRTLDDVMEEIETWKAILEWCVAQNIRLIFASTSSLCKSRPSQESQLVWPGSLYELAKLMMENMTIQQALSDRLTLQICRFFSVYGVTEQHKGDFGNLYTQILWHALARQPFEVWEQANRFTAGEQTRDIIFASEVTRAMLHLLTLPKPDPKLDDISTLVYNIGLGNPVSVKKMIQQVASLLPNEFSPIIVNTEIPPILSNYVVDTWGEPAKLLASGFQPIFTDHVANLKFIVHSLLSQLEWYWSVVEEIRQLQFASRR